MNIFEKTYSHIRIQNNLSSLSIMELPRPKAKITRRLFIDWYTHPNRDQLAAEILFVIPNIEQASFEDAK